jgi:glycerol-3-phosphate O-acyltransferase / dihydroxyacetone phosphate acyltransferase
MPSQAGTEEAAAPQAASNPTPQKELYPMVNWKYDLFLYVIGNMVNLFFREVVPRGSWKVPKSGPVLFVAAPHANQVRHDFLASLFFFARARVDPLSHVIIFFR